MPLTDHIKTVYKAAASEFNITVSDFRPEIEMSGSPERSEMRSVIECSDQKLYVLECVFDEDVRRKKNIASTLDYFAIQNVSEINPYLKTDSGDAVIKSQDRFWMMSPFIEGIPLKRPDYVFDKWRGGILATFLMTLKDTSENLLTEVTDKPFSIFDYISKLLKDIRENDPQVLPRLDMVVGYLESHFITQHDRLPLRFCHGDYHPLNIIWSDTHINAVIDWEFSGIKPEGYDLANLIGCLGMENPESLKGELLCDLVSTLRSSTYLEAISWETLIPFIVAIRFAWLAEWLRRRDNDMIELEIVYMQLLVENAENIKVMWSLK